MRMFRLPARCAGDVGSARQWPRGSSLRRKARFFASRRASALPERTSAAERRGRSSPHTEKAGIVPLPPWKKGPSDLPAEGPFPVPGRARRRRSNVNLKISAIQYAGAMRQPPLFGQAREGRFDSGQKIHRNGQPVVSGKDPVRMQPLNPLHGAPEQLRIRGRVKRVETALIDQVAGVEIPARRLVKAAVPRGVAGRVEDGERPVSQRNNVAIAQNPALGGP